METGTQLTVRQRATNALAVIDTAEKLQALAKQSEEITAVTNPASYQQLHQARMTLKNKRVEIQKIAKTARDDATKFSKAVIDEEKRLISIIEPEETRLEAIQTEYDERIEREKQERIAAELRRVEQIQFRIENDLRRIGFALNVMEGSAEIAAALQDVQAHVIDDSFAEFKGEAEAAKVASVKRLTDLHVQALAYEANLRRMEEERAELARLKAEEDKRQKEAAQVEAARIRKQAEEDAARQAEIDRQAREARLKIEAQERAAQERIAEQERVARIEREAQERKDAEVRAAEQARLREQEEKLAAERRELEEAQRKQREEVEAKERAERQRQEEIERETREQQARQEEKARAKARAEQEKREEIEREAQRKAAELLDLRSMLVTVCDRCGDAKEFSGVAKAINSYFAKYGDPRRGEDHREAA